MPKNTLGKKKKKIGERENLEKNQMHIPSLDSKLPHPRGAYKKAGERLFT